MNALPLKIRDMWNSHHNTYLAAIKIKEYGSTPVFVESA
jgi:hypothetical protein